MKAGKLYIRLLSRIIYFRNYKFLYILLVYYDLKGKGNALSIFYYKKSRFLIPHDIRLILCRSVLKNIFFLMKEWNLSGLLEQSIVLSVPLLTVDKLILWTLTF